MPPSKIRINHHRLAFSLGLFVIESLMWAERTRVGAAIVQFPVTSLVDPKSSPSSPLIQNLADNLQQSIPAAAASDVKRIYMRSDVLPNKRLNENSTGNWRDSHTELNTQESVAIESTVGAPSSLLTTSATSTTSSTTATQQGSPLLAAQIPHMQMVMNTISPHEPQSYVDHHLIHLNSNDNQEQQRLASNPVKNIGISKSSHESHDQSTNEAISNKQQQHLNVSQRSQRTIDNLLMEDSKDDSGLTDFSNASVDDDLQVAGGHHMAKKSPHSHHHDSKYYMYAESHHKGDFDSGYKLGGHKMTISGHSSIHKGHANGHVKWDGKKGKGMHIWEYNHKDKGKKHKYHHHH